MATYSGRMETRSVGLAGLVIRMAAMGLVAYSAVTWGPGLLDKVTGGSAVIEEGYVNPKSLSIQSKKNEAGNVEAYLQYKVGDEIVSLPCFKGPSGPLCGKVEYWWESIGGQQREALTVSEWPEISNSSKHGIMSSELQTILDTFYGPQKQQPAPAPQQPQQYKSGK
ncbi:hypothetical protein HYU18_04010 [Candidatus Woesearchaeota archaeon]|nr:hypothetical protein [Candidatus Woesearchaeota archaeon]